MSTKSRGKPTPKQNKREVRAGKGGTKRPAPRRTAPSAIKSAAPAPAYTPRDWTYAVHPMVNYNLKIIGNMPEKTGRSLEQWTALLRGEGPRSDAAAQTAWLKKRGLGTGTACLVVEHASGRLSEWCSGPAYLREAKGYVEALFAGNKAWMRPLYDALMEASLALGDDVKACPCETIVPIYRTHVIAQIKPATTRRLDFGLALGATKGDGRLVETGGYAKKDRITHRVEVRTIADIDTDLIRWLRQAYRMDV